MVGYYFSIRREVSSDDVLRAVKRALGRWSPRSVSFSDTPYLPDAGLLAAAGEDFVGLCWDETSVDGALAETCQRVRDALRDAVGSALLDPKTSFSKRRSKDDRPFIEAFSETWPARDSSAYPAPLAPNHTIARETNRKRLRLPVVSSTSMQKNCSTCSSPTITRRPIAESLTVRR